MAHVHAGAVSSRQLWLATLLTFVFCLGEAVAGYITNSLALMADAGHNFADALALAISAFALWMVAKPADLKRTFGYHRVGILAALVNGVGLVVMAALIFWKAWQRLRTPEVVQSGPMIGVALLAILLNAGIAWWLFRAAKEDLNIRGVFLHMTGDAAASFGVVVAGVIIAFTGAYIADPLVSMVFAALVLWSSWSILAESVQVLMEATPMGLDLAGVEQAVCRVDGVLAIHDLHVWTVSSGLIAGSCHIVVAEQSATKSQQVQQKVAQLLEHEFNIRHSTIQVEVAPCGGHAHTSHRHDGHHHHPHSH